MLQTRNLSRRFAGLSALRGVSLDVREREIFGVIGPNGAGKTTLFNLLSGIIRANEGEITFKGYAIHNLPCHRIARLGMTKPTPNTANVLSSDMVLSSPGKNSEEIVVAK